MPISTNEQEMKPAETEIAVHWQEEDYYHPSAEFIAQANLTAKSIYQDFVLENFPNCFTAYADLLSGFKKWDTVLDTSDAPCWKWAMS